MPQVVIFDGFQGCEDDLIILDLTPANEYHGSKLGFLKEFWRINVAISRAKAMLWTIGNLDCWRSELKVLVESPHLKPSETKKFAWLMVDYLDSGDVIDWHIPTQCLPTSPEEFGKMFADPDATPPMIGHDYKSELKAYWTHQQPKMDQRASELRGREYFLATEFKKLDDAAKLAYEFKVLKQLEPYRKRFRTIDAAWKENGKITHDFGNEEMEDATNAGVVNVDEPEEGEVEGEKPQTGTQLSAKKSTDFPVPAIGSLGLSGDIKRQRNDDGKE